MREYKIDKNTSELWVIEGPFITRIKNYVSTIEPGRYLYYNMNMAVEVITDFRGKLTILGHHDSSAEYFGVTTIHFNDAGIIVFGLDSNHSSLSWKPIAAKGPRSIFRQKCKTDDEFNRPIRATRSVGDIPGSCDYLFTKTSHPVVITSGPYGYSIDGYYLYVIRHGQPTSYIVYDINGNENQEPYVKMNIPKNQ